MFGTHHSFHKAHKLNQGQGGKEYPKREFLRRLYQQAKQVSQIIAYIWRWADEEQEKYAKRKEYANTLKKYFNQPASTQKGQEVGGNLKKLFQANPADNNDKSLEADLLRAVFFEDCFDNRDYIFPIFDKFELGNSEHDLGYLFEIKVNSFHGTLEDADRNSPDLFKFIIPYPPRPAFGETTLNKETLDKWIENRVEDQYFAENPYIPTTCS